jgi:hypothetical protein
MLDANHAQLHGCFAAVAKTVFRYSEKCAFTYSNRIRVIRIPSQVMVPDHDRSHFRHSGFGTTQVRTQSCMNLCEVGLVIVNGVFLGKTSRKGIGSTTDLTLS